MDAQSYNNGFAVGLALNARPVHLEIINPHPPTSSCEYGLQQIIFSPNSINLNIKIVPVVIGTRP